MRGWCCALPCCAAFFLSSCPCAPSQLLRYTAGWSWGALREAARRKARCSIHAGHLCWPAACTCKWQPLPTSILASWLLSSPMVGQLQAVAGAEQPQTKRSTQAGRRACPVQPIGPPTKADAFPPTLDLPDLGSLMVEAEQIHSLQRGPGQMLACGSASPASTTGDEPTRQGAAALPVAVACAHSGGALAAGRGLARLEKRRVCGGPPLEGHEHGVVVNNAKGGGAHLREAGQAGAGWLCQGRWWGPPVPCGLRLQFSACPVQARPTPPRTAGSARSSRRCRGRPA